MQKLFKHLKLVHQHRKYVRKICFKMGIFWRGIVHDLSKYSIQELKIAKYYNGKKSPHQQCRDEIGYSPSWIHHKHKNKHHYQYWQDDDEDNKIIPIKMPYKYCIEMFCDMVGAGMAYSKDKWNTGSPIEYWEEHCIGKAIIHEETISLMNTLFSILKQYNTIDEFYVWYKKHKKEIKKRYETVIL